MESSRLLAAVASELEVSEDDLVANGIRAFLESQLRQVSAEILEICGRYGVAGAEAMDARYRDGSLPEADSWRDLQRLDHLEYKRDQLGQLLARVG